jgi:hypothetical protein
LRQRTADHNEEQEEGKKNSHWNPPFGDTNAPEIWPECHESVGSAILDITELPQQDASEHT